MNIFRLSDSYVLVRFRIKYAVYYIRTYQNLVLDVYQVDMHDYDSNLLFLRLLADGRAPNDNVIHKLIAIILLIISDINTIFAYEYS